MNLRSLILYFFFVSNATGQQVENLITQLGSDDRLTRTVAIKTLTDMGNEVYSPLEVAEKTSRSSMIRTSAGMILEEIRINCLVKSTKVNGEFSGTISDILAALERNSKNSLPKLNSTSLKKHRFKFANKEFFCCFLEVLKECDHTLIEVSDGLEFSLEIVEGDVSENLYAFCGPYCAQIEKNSLSSTSSSLILLAESKFGLKVDHQAIKVVSGSSQIRPHSATVDGYIKDGVGLGFRMRLLKKDSDDSFGPPLEGLTLFSNRRVSFGSSNVIEYPKCTRSLCNAFDLSFSEFQK